MLNYSKFGGGLGSERVMRTFCVRSAATFIPHSVGWLLYLNQATVPYNKPVDAKP